MRQGRLLQHLEHAERVGVDAGQVDLEVFAHRRSFESHPGRGDPSDGVDDDCDGIVDDDFEEYCREYGVVTAACTAGRCVVVTCGENQADCAASGTECATYLPRSESHCGACGRTCDGLSCVAGMCAPWRSTSLGALSTCAQAADGIWECWSVGSTPLRTGLATGDDVLVGDGCVVRPAAVIP